MKLVMDHSTGAYAVRVPCIGCGRLVQLSEAQIDIEGPAFKAYYHQGCVPIGAQLAVDRRPVGNISLGR